MRNINIQHTVNLLMKQNIGSHMFVKMLCLLLGNESKFTFIKNVELS